MIETTDLTKRRGATAAVDAVSLTVERGAVFGLLGPNGAGKSTLCSLLAGQTNPTDGTASVCGVDPAADGDELDELVGYVGERVDLPDGTTGREHVRRAIANADGDAAPAALLDRVGVGRDAAGRPAKTYAAGTARRVALAAALGGDPDLLVLDDPTAGLDREGVLRLRAILRAETRAGTTVVVAGRRLADLPVPCDRVGVLNDGELLRVERLDGAAATAGAGAGSGASPAGIGVSRPASRDSRDPATPGDRLVELRVERVPDVDLTAIPGVESVVAEDNEIAAVVSSPAATPTVVLEVAHADVAIRGVSVTDLGPVSLYARDETTENAQGRDP